jgi:hypothetical protein
MSVTPLPVQSDYHATMQPPILLSRANRKLPLRNPTFIQHCRLRPVSFCQYAEDMIRVIRWSRAGGTLKRTRFIAPKCTSSRQCCCFPFTPIPISISVNKFRQRARGFGSNQNRTEDFLHEAISFTPENCSLAANSPLDRTPLSLNNLSDARRFHCTKKKKALLESTSGNHNFNKLCPKSTYI